MRKKSCKKDWRKCQKVSGKSSWPVWKLKGHADRHGTSRNSSSNNKDSVNSVNLARRVSSSSSSKNSNDSIFVASMCGP